jgi:hypothetical protein
VCASHAFSGVSFPLPFDGSFLQVPLATQLANLDVQVSSQPSAVSDEQGPYAALLDAALRSDTYTPQSRVFFVSSFAD